MAIFESNQENVKNIEFKSVAAKRLFGARANSTENRNYHMPQPSFGSSILNQ